MQGLYRRTRRLGESGTGALHLAIREADGQEVALKSYGAERGPVEREFELLRKVAGPGVVQAFEVDVGSDPPALVLERLPGVELGTLARTLDSARFLVVAQHLAETLERIHKLGVVHRDLKPQNIIVDPQSLQVWIIDFEAATELGGDRRSALAERATLTRATPLYMSPEQGRQLGRAVDFRSDLYALGATLYHVLAGRPPFCEDDLHKLIHAHMAVAPEPPHEVRPQVCSALSRLVLKLLEKEPEHRYQSARSLLLDVIECRRQLDERGEIDPDIVLGTGDLATRPLFSRKLYGREQESAALEVAFERACCGRRELWLVRGAPGVGKSALVESVRSRALAAGGLLAQGKFDVYQRDRQYHGWVGALQSLLDQLLARGTAKDVDWELRLEEGLGATAGALLEIAPDLRFLMPEVLPVAPLDSAQTLIRLASALARLMETVATPEQPLVLVLDDLQWADAGSRALLLELLRSDREAALLILGTYRDNEEGARSSCALLKQQLDTTGVPVHSIELTPLELDAVEGMLCDVLQRAPEDVRWLARCTQRKTGNNPFLVREFLEHLRTRELIRYAPGVGWHWDDQEVAAAQIPDGAVGLMLERIARLPPNVREVLVFASFVGDEFDADLLRALAHRDLGRIEAALLELSEAGMIAACHAGFRFAHDRIREAAQSLLSERERARLHYDTANLLFDRASAEQRRASAAELADQFNRARDLIQPEQRVPVLELNLWAAERALAAGAPDTASAYAESAHALLVAEDAYRQLHPDDPDAIRDLRFDLEYLRAKTRTLAGRHAEAEAILAPLTEGDGTDEQLARAVSLRIEILACVAREQGFDGPCAQRAIAIGTRALRRLGAPYPAKPSLPRAVAQAVRAYASTRRLGVDDLLIHAAAPDARRAALAQIESALGRVSFARPARALYFTAYALRHLRDGYAGPNLAHALYTVGWALGGFLHWNTAAERLGGLALELIRRGYAAALPHRTTAYVHYAIYSWTRPLAECVVHLERTIQPAVEEGGDPITASLAAAMSTRLRVDVGAPVPVLLESSQATTRLAKAANDFGFLTAFSYATRCLERLADESPIAAEEPLRAYSGAAWSEVHRGWFWFLMSEFELANEALANIPPTTGFPTREPLHRGLAAAICTRGADPSRRRALWRTFRADRRKLRRWARRGPRNFQHLHLLLDAEHARLASGLPERALTLGQAAERGALDGGYLCDAVFARERCVHYLRDLHRDLEAAHLLRKVVEQWKAWGAGAKVTHLRHQHADLLKLRR